MNYEDDKSEEMSQDDENFFSQGRFNQDISRNINNRNHDTTDDDLA